MGDWRTIGARRVAAGVKIVGFSFMSLKIEESLRRCMDQYRKGGKERVGYINAASGDIRSANAISQPSAETQRVSRNSEFRLLRFS